MIAEDPNTKGTGLDAEEKKSPVAYNHLLADEELSVDESKKTKIKSKPEEESKQEFEISDSDDESLEPLDEEGKLFLIPQVAIFGYFCKNFI